MSFADAVRSCFSQYVGFAGRARRSEFWYFYLFTVVVSVVALLIDRAILHSGNIGVVGSLVSLLLFLPQLAVGARRLHDTGRSGWWLLLGLIPIIGGIVLIVFWVQDSHGDNAHGPSPKGAAAAYPAASV
jgi:uncharacterized membrane protein YhaH (DUF805 family)